MQTRLYSIILLGIASSMGCGGISFDVKLDSETIVERGTLIEQLLPVVFDSFIAIDLTETQEFKNEQVGRDRVKSVLLSSFAIEVTHPPDESDLSFLRSLEFFVEADDLAQERIAYSDEDAFSQGVRRVDLQLDDVELQPFVVADHFSVTSKVSASRRPPVDTTIRGEIVFRVKAGL